MNPLSPPTTADPHARPHGARAEAPGAPATASDVLTVEAESNQRFTGPDASAQLASGPVLTPSLHYSITPSLHPHGPLSHNERFQLLVAAAAALRKSIIDELDALSRLVTADEFCTGCCHISKEITCLSSALMSAQLNVRLGGSAAQTPPGDRPHRIITNRKPKL